MNAIQGMRTIDSNLERFQLVESKCKTEIVGDWDFKICSVFPSKLETLSA